MYIKNRITEDMKTATTWTSHITAPKRKENKMYNYIRFVIKCR